MILIDNTKAVDPSERYYLDSHLLQQEHSTFVNVKSAVGAAIVVAKTGCSMIVPPHSFQVIDIYDHDLANTSGMDISIVLADPYDTKLTLPNIDVQTESYVSALVIIKPTPTDTFLKPMACCIPHSARLDAENYELHVLQLLDDDLGGQEYARVMPEKYRLNNIIGVQNLFTSLKLATTR